jgi:hypothetical protein
MAKPNRKDDMPEPSETKYSTLPGEMEKRPPPGFKVLPPAFFVTWTQETHNSGGNGLICDPRAPLEHNSRVVVEIEMRRGPRYFEGRLITKHPTKARSLNVRLLNGFTEPRIEKRHVSRVIYDVRS